MEKLSGAGIFLPVIYERHSVGHPSPDTTPIIPKYNNPSRAESGWIWLSHERDNRHALHRAAPIESADHLYSFSVLQKRNLRTIVWWLISRQSHPPWVLTSLHWQRGNKPKRLRVRGQESYLPRKHLGKVVSLRLRSLMRWPLVIRW